MKRDRKWEARRAARAKERLARLKSDRDHVDPHYLGIGARFPKEKP